MKVLEIYAQHVSRPYVGFLQRFGLDFEVARASGVLLQDRQGRQYIDCVGGYGNLNIGHNHPHVVNRLVRTLQEAKPFGWPFISEAQVELADTLARLSPSGLECCLIVNSGSEAVDSALKLTRLATGRSGIVCCEGGWHGFTLGALSVSEPEMCRSFGKLLPEVTRVPYGDAKAAISAITSDTGAMIVEPIQSESGGIVPPDGYLKELASACNEYGVVLILDEIKTGMGKTGRMFACEFDSVEPDILLAGKSLGGGVMPIGSLIAKRKWWTKFGLSFAMTSSSAAGNSLACAAALAAIEVIQSEDLCSNAEKQGGRLLQALLELTTTFPDAIRGVTGRGLLLGLHTASPRAAFEIAAECLRSGVLIMPAFLDRATLLIEPPLCIDENQIDQVSSTLQHAFRTLSSHA
jgi:putrescine aminotransferase